MATCTIKDCRKEATEIIWLGGIKNPYCLRCFNQVTKTLEREQRNHNPL